MKKKLLCIFIALLFVVAGCQGNDNGQGRNNNNDNDNNNVEPTRYNDAVDRNLDNDSRRNRLNHNGDQTFDRDLENSRYRNINRNNNNNNNNRYDVAEEAADRITDQIPEIDSAYVLTTDNNAYVAAQLDNDRKNRNNRNNNNNDDGDELTDEVKNKIGDIVKSVDNDIDNVYVSTNPDFVDLVNNYVNDMNNGRPVRGFFDQMGNMIERLFPQNR